MILRRLPGLVSPLRLATDTQMVGIASPSVPEVVASEGQ